MDMSHAFPAQAIAEAEKFAQLEFEADARKREALAARLAEEEAQKAAEEAAKALADDDDDDGDEGDGGDDDNDDDKSAFAASVGLADAALTEVASLGAEKSALHRDPPDAATAELLREARAALDVAAHVDYAARRAAVASVEICYARAGAAYELDDARSAIYDLDAALAQRPGHAPSLALRAKARCALGQFPEGKRDCLKAKRLLLAERGLRLPEDADAPLPKPVEDVLNELDLVDIGHEVDRGLDQGRKRLRRWPTSKAPISVVCHSFRAIISRNGLEA